MLTKIYEQNPSERELQKVVDVLVHDCLLYTSRAHET